MEQNFNDAYQQAWIENIVWIIVGVLIFFILMRLILSIPKLLKHQKAQTALLFEIAKKVNVEKEMIDSITVDFDNSSIV